MGTKSNDFPNTVLFRGAGSLLRCQCVGIYGASYISSFFLPRFLHLMVSTYVTLQLQPMPSQDPLDLILNLVNLVIPVFHHQNQVLANHPNSYLYRTLSTLVDVEGYYLESEPCLVCNDPEIHFVNVCSYSNTCLKT